MKLLRIACIAVLVLASVPHAPAAASASSIEAKIQAEKAKAAQIHQRLRAKRAELGTVTLRYNDLAHQLHETNVAIAGINGRIGALQGQAASTQRRIDWNTVQLDAARRSLKLHDDMLRRRLVDIYENGNLTYLSVLLSAHSFSEFVERWEDLRLLIAANERAVRARKRAEARVASVEADLERTRLELLAQQQAQEQARSQLDSLASERQNLVALTAAQRRHVADQVAQMEDLSAAEEAQLEALIQERERELAAERKAAGIAGGVESESGQIGRAHV